LFLFLLVIHQSTHHIRRQEGDGLKDEGRALLVFGWSLLFPCKRHVNSFAFLFQYKQRRFCGKINFGHLIQ
jgi:hypothetical protein